MPPIEPVLVPRLPPIFASRRARRIGIALLGLIIVVLVGSASAVARFLPMLLDASALRAYIAGFGIWAPLVFVLLQTGQIVLAPIPGHLFALVAGYLFGPYLGTGYSLLGALIGSAIAFTLSRRYGRPLVEQLLHPETLATVDGFVDEHGRVAIFVVFLLPGLPDDALCLAAGLTKLPLWQLLVLSTVGRVPGYFLATLAGDQLAVQRPLAAAVILLALAVVTLVVYWQHEAILSRWD